MDKETSLEYFDGDDLASSVWLSKYAWNEEPNPSFMHKRMARELWRMESKYIDKESLLNTSELDLSKHFYKRPDLTYKKIYNLMSKFKYVVPQGSIMGVLGTDILGSLSNCFVIGQPSDSIGGIHRKDEELSQLMKRRGGVGLDLSLLRPSGSPTSNSAKSSTGPVSFAHRYSNSTNEIAQNGRRGALMLSLRIEHPDSLQFIESKTDEDKTSLTGANISVAVTNDFMDHVIDDVDFLLRWPVNADVSNIDMDSLEYDELVRFEGLEVRKIKAKDYWIKLVTAARNSAEPGILFIDNHWDYSPDSVYPEYKGVTTNPCFVGDTKVLMEGGSYKNIKDIRVGDKVISYDTATRIKNINTVTNSSKTRINAEVIKVVLSNGEEIVCTPDHPFYDLINSDYRKPYVEMILKSIGETKLISIKSIEYLLPEDVYDITVENDHNFFVSESNILVHNCGEIFMQPYDACRLLAINLFSFVRYPFTKDAHFDYKKFNEVVYDSMRLSDDIVDLEVEHIDRIINKILIDDTPEDDKFREYELWRSVRKTTLNSRRIGLGHTALGDTLAALGIKYDSEESLYTVNKIFKQKLESELACTIDMAILRGNFMNYDPELEFDVEMKDTHGNPDYIFGLNKFYSMITKELPEEAERMLLHGRRNVSWSTVAPTGSVSIMTQTTSGIEPLFMSHYIRRKKVNPDDKDVNIDFIDNNGVSWTSFPVIHPKFKDWIKLTYQLDDESVNKLSNDDLNQFFENSPWYKATANDIDWKFRIDIQSIIQKYTTHSISSTLNLPKDVSVDEVQDIYLYAYEKGLKGVTIYREGSRDGVLINHNTHNTDTDIEIRPETLPCEIHFSVTDGKEWLVVIGLYNEIPYEVFCIKNKFNLKRNIYKGSVTKLGNGYYNVVFENENLNLDPINVEMTDIQRVITRLISAYLKKGKDIPYLLEQIAKGDSKLTSFSKSIGRVLKKYVKDGESVGLTCENCGSDKVIYQEGCNLCQDCGFSSCS